MYNDEMKTKTTVILLAGGRGTRMGQKTPKQFLALGGKPLALYSFELFCQMPRIGEIVVVCAKEYEHLFSTPKKLLFARGGNERQDSVFNGLQMADSKADFICIHDAARPFIDQETVEKVLDAAIECGAAAPGAPAINTIKECDSAGIVVKTPARDHLFEIQTPQVLRRSILEEGYELLRRENRLFTDDVSIAEALGYMVKIVKNNRPNFKVTTPFDLQIAKLLCQTNI